jgi:HK97 family phage portal protein
MSWWNRLLGRLRTKDPPAADTVGSELWELFEAATTAAGIRVNSFTALQQVAVYACVQILSEDVAKLPLQICRGDPQGNHKPAKDHFLYKLLIRPNAWQTRFEFIEMMTAALALRTNAYAVIVRDGRGQPQQLVPIHPDRVELFEAPGGDWFYSVSRNGLHEISVLEHLPVMIAAEDMLHLRGMASWNSLVGMSRVGVMREAIGLALSQEQQAARLAGTGARPAGVLQTKDKLSPDVIERLKEQWQKNYGGLRNTGKTAVLEQGLEWKQMGMSSVDAEFMAARQFQLEEIARMFRVPPHKLGIVARTTGTTLVQQDQEYLNNVLSGYCERWTSKLGRTFDIDLTDDLFLDFDYSHFLKADIQTRLTAKRIGVAGMIYTPNEARAGEGLAPVAGGDTLYQPTNVAPIGFTPSAPSSGPGSDQTGEPAPGGDGDPAAPPDDQAPST